MSMTELERESKRFAGNVGVCRHEVENRYCSCGDRINTGDNKRHEMIHNPTYTIEFIRAELERVNKLDAVIRYEHKRVADTCHKRDSFACDCIITFTKAMQTPLYLLQAANAYIAEERADATYQTQQVMEDR